MATDTGRSRDASCCAMATPTFLNVPCSRECDTQHNTDPVARLVVSKIGERGAQIAMTLVLVSMHAED